jgi:putative DNA primase/helicase
MVLLKRETGEPFIKSFAHGGQYFSLWSELERAQAEFERHALPPEKSCTVALPEMTEDAAALQFAERHKDRFRFDHTGRQWYRYIDGLGWEIDHDGAVSRAARDFVRNARAQWGEERSKGAGRIAFAGAVQRGAQDDAHMAVTRESWDVDAFVLGVPGGYVDLRTGELHPACSDRLLRTRTSVAPAPPGTDAPIWLRFLSDATAGDISFQLWLQRLAGYSLTGDVSEETLAFLYGPGGNGKGVFLHTISTIWGPYAYQAPSELFKADSRLNREYQLARLDGIRLLMASETEAGSALAEGFVKELTGNEGNINARHPFGRPFEFRPCCKVVIVGNHAPKLRDRSAAMERRLRVAPFRHKPQHPDPDLKNTLSTEYPAILRWAIDGCLMWQQQRLGTCSAVAEASADYFAEQDVIAQWAAERCDIGPALQGSGSALLDDFNSWTRGRGEKPTDSKSFKEIITRLPGITWHHTRRGSTFFGIGLRALDDDMNSLAALM